MSTITITVRPEAFSFTSSQEPDLLEALSEADRNTVITPLNGPQDVLLNPDTGQTYDGYNYTDVSLPQICRLASPGLIQVLLDVSGQWRKPAEDRRHYSSVQAVDIFNRLVKLRFERKMTEVQFVRDTKRKIIDGVVGVRYRYLSNSDFFTNVKRIYKDTDTAFFEAMLYGRNLVLRYAHTEDSNIAPACTIGDDKYLVGYHFANSEIGGRSVRTAIFVGQPTTRYAALSPYRDGSGGRVIHSGRGFERRLHTLLGMATSRIPSQYEIECGGRALLARSLQLGTKLHDKTMKNLVSLLNRRKLKLSFSKRVVSSMASRGRDETNSIADYMPDERRLALESRTAYDFFVALIREARGLPLDQQELAEQVAYGLLTGKITI